MKKKKKKVRIETLKFVSALVVDNHDRATFYQGADYYGLPFILHEMPLHEREKSLREIINAKWDING